MVLKQDEVDALLDLAQQSEPDDVAPAPDAADQRDQPPTASSEGYNLVPADSVAVFDFKRPTRVSREQEAAIEALHKAFARTASVSLSDYLRTLVEFRLISVDQLSYSEFSMSVPTPTIFTSLTCSPLEGSLILDMNPSIVYPFIDRLLGGRSVEPYHLDRPFTLIEQGLIGSIISKLLEQLHETWLAIVDLTFRVDEMETNPSLLQIVPPNEPVILVSFEVTMGDHSGLLNICLPDKVVDPVVDRLSQTSWSPLQEIRDEDGVPEILDTIGEAEVDISVILAELDVRMVDVLNMQPGDILDCGRAADGELELTVGREHLFRGKPCTSNNRNGIVVVGMAKNDEAALATSTQKMPTNESPSDQTKASTVSITA